MDFAANSADRRHASEWLEPVAAGAMTTFLLVFFIRWLDDVHVNTMNGLWKSLRVAQWKADLAAVPLDPSNYLYFPMMGILCRALDLAGIHVGEAWRQMAIVNAGFAGVAVGIVFWLVRRLTGRSDVAALAALVHLGCAFFFSLAVSNEDIMPSYTLVLASMAMAAVWFAAPTAGQVVLVAAIFTLGWLTEWRLMFPTLPPLLLALALSQGGMLRRAGCIVLFLAAMIGTALIVLTVFRGHPGAVGLPGVLWTGKGVRSGWSGVSLDKLGLVVVGMGEYWLGGHNIPSPDVTSPLASEWGLAFAAEMLALVLALVLLWRRRRDPALRTAAVVFIGTLVAGEVMNAYSQPQDPQMQINVMAWLAVVVALLVGRLSGGAGVRPVIMVLAFCCALFPLAYNVRAFAPLRGRDGQMVGAVRALESQTDPDRTVFVYAGFETIVAWQFALWGPNWEGVCDLGAAPQAVPKFKWISLFGPLVHHPSWTDDEYAAAIRREIECAFDKGYRVVVGGLVWQKSPAELAEWMTSLNARARAPVLHALLHDNRRTIPLAKPILDDSFVIYQELVRP
ncbi:MAG: hypothetical protein JSR90_17575 [Proteobacteria bacterium]|nr:hypothetical protein [Pseudomonadota bacterium]